MSCWIKFSQGKNNLVCIHVRKLKTELYTEDGMMTINSHLFCAQMQLPSFLKKKTFEKADAVTKKRHYCVFSNKNTQNNKTTKSQSGALRESMLHVHKA